MIVKRTVACKPSTATTASPDRESMATTTSTNRNAETKLGVDATNDDGDNYRYSMGSAKIQMRLVISLMFAVLPGVIQVPSSLAIGGGGGGGGNTNVPLAAVTAASSLERSDTTMVDKKRSADAARLLLEDYGGGSKNYKRPETPASVKRQMDMQDHRLANCHESSEAGNWEQCFFWGTDNASSGSGDLYFFEKSSNNGEPSANGMNEKPKIPTW
eukprot:CAMPEP_0201241696 /NCGR_PEP_ID=MMETSP0852-20130820/35084_1 /ASSEMBLY_ACC=CAM_ASM_000632 /TAXON_ID=183588 /ORGANISM="Pseudo-nitzschia fraudulenta, Strain WWA7" /LENGTH=214 /DNA_ID=CAMNT_0047538069 /DNA_START=49 /DNA_END=693 /DNA_ORIENTATION=+